MSELTCVICGAELPPRHSRYCSEACQRAGNQEHAKAAKARQTIRLQEMRSRPKKVTGLDEYGRWDRERILAGKKHISYGKLQGGFKE